LKSSIILSAALAFTVLAFPGCGETQRMPTAEEVNNGPTLEFPKQETKSTSSSRTPVN